MNDGSNHVHVSRPRPPGQRRANEYVELNGRPPPRHTPSEGAVPKVHVSSSRVITSQPSSYRQHRSAPPTTLPTRPSIEKKPASSGRPSPLSHICRECGRCRCSACANSVRSDFGNVGCRLGGCNVTPQTCIDAVTCACVLNAAWYHCGGAEDDSTPPPQPLATRYNPEDVVLPPALDPRTQDSVLTCMRNWTLLGLASLCLPCLCCYPPLMALKACVGRCHRKCNARGCQCRPPRVLSPPLEGRGLTLSPPPARQKSAPPRMLNGYDNMGKLLQDDPL